MAEFLFEIGLEEVPARMIAGAQAELQRRVVAMLERERLVGVGDGEQSHDNLASGAVIMGHPRVKSFSTPRRLAVWVGEVAARQQDVAEEMVGPAVKIAYKDGVPTPAAMAFAKKAGVAVEALKTVTTPKGEYLAATAVKAGRAAAEVIAEEMPKELAGIYWAKNMYWRAGKPERFVRPVRWMMALLGDVVVPVSFGGKTAGRATHGHRVLAGDAAIEIAAPDEYEQALVNAKVVADVEARRQVIRKALDRVCRTVPDTRWREDHALVDKLTHLTEWPTVIAGGFEREYLTLPEEVLVTVMRDHQSYFAVDDGVGKLAPHFLAVLNTETDAKGEDVIRHGNERVLRARFNDARFFWEFDQRVTLKEREGLLEKVTFQKDLGSYAAKTERVRVVAEALAALLRERKCEIGSRGAWAGGEVGEDRSDDRPGEGVYGVAGTRWADCMRGRRGTARRCRLRSTISICRSRWRTRCRGRWRVRCWRWRIRPTRLWECSGWGWSRRVRRIRLRCGGRRMGL